jgi:ABC-type uncharacterized transport system auxiliary subunit
MPFASPRRHHPVREEEMTRLLAALALAAALAGCGATQRLDNERIRQNAEEADQDLDRESAKDDKEESR